MLDSIKQFSPRLFWTLLVFVSFYIWMVPAIKAPAPIVISKYDPDSFYILYSRDMVEQIKQTGHASWWGHPGLPLQIVNCALHWTFYVCNGGDLEMNSYAKFWYPRLTESWLLARSMMFVASLIVLFLIFCLLKILDGSVFTQFVAMLLTIYQFSHAGVIYFWTHICPDAFALLFFIPSFIFLYFAVDKFKLSGLKSNITLVGASFLVVSAMFTKLHTMGVMLPIALSYIFFNDADKKLRWKAVVIFVIATIVFSIPYLAILNIETFISGWSTYAKQTVEQFNLPNTFFLEFTSYFGFLLILGFAGTVLLIYQKKYREPLFRSILLFLFFIVALNIFFLFEGLPRLHYLLPAIPFLGYAGANFLSFLLNKTIPSFPRTLILSKVIVFTLLVAFFLVPVLKKEAISEYSISEKYQKLKIDELFSKAASLKKDEYLLFPEEVGYGSYFFSLALSPFMSKKLPIETPLQKPLSVDEVKTFSQQKKIAYIIAPSLGEKIFFTPEEWLYLVQNSK